MIKNILVMLGLVFYAGLQAQDVDFIQKIDNDAPFPIKTSTGHQVAIDRDYAVVTAPNGSLPSAGEHGIAIVYKYDPVQNIWNEIKIIAPSILRIDVNFGWEASISGDIIAISESGSVQGSIFQDGNVFLFQKDLGGLDNWGEVKRLESPSPQPLFYGFGIDLSDDVLVVNSAVSNQIFLYERNEGGADNWGLVKTIMPPAFLGTVPSGIDISGDQLIYSIQQIGTYIHERNEGGANNWGEVKFIQKPSNVSNTGLGGTAIQDSLAIVGDKSNGIVRIYKKDNGGVDNWGFAQAITKEAEFGLEIELKDSLVIVGNRTSNVNGNNSGQVHIYRITDSLTAPLQEIKVLTPCTPAIDDYFGNDVAIQGDQVLVGAVFVDFNAGTTTDGRALFFDRNEGGADNWGEVLVVEDSPSEPFGQFGSTIDTYGDLMITSSPNDDNSQAFSSGSAYLYHRDQDGLNNWGEVKRFVSPNPVTGIAFGKQVKLFENIAVISDNNNIYIYHEDEGGIGNWGLIQTIAQSSDLLDIHGDILIVTLEKDMLVFQKDEGGVDNWGFLLELAKPLGGIDKIGSVSIFEDDILIGDPGRAVSSGIQGNVYYYKRNQNGANLWGFVERLVASDGFIRDDFGSDLSIYDDLLVVSSKNGNTGGARQLYIFEKEESGFVEKKIIPSFEPSVGSKFSNSVAITDRYIVTGDERANDTGEGYIFGRNVGGASNWGLVSTIISQEGTVGDKFAFEVAITGNSVFLSSHGDVNITGKFRGRIDHFEIEPNEKVWTGNVNSDWDNPLNWSPGMVPVAGDEVVIPLRDNEPILDVQTAMLRSITLKENASMEVVGAGKLNLEE